jgi:6-phosphogluconolactonase (cycloisomerase 2 family)
MGVVCTSMAGWADNQATEKVLATKSASEPLPGQLIPLNPPSISLLDFPMGGFSYLYIAANPVNQDVYVASVAGGPPEKRFPVLVIFRPDKESGLLTKLDQFMELEQGVKSVLGIAVDRLGQYAYIVFGGGIEVYKIDLEKGTFKYLSTVSADFGFTDIIVADPIKMSRFGDYVYVFSPSAKGGANVFAYEVGADGTLTFVGTSNIESTQAILQLIVAPSGKYAYALEAHKILKYGINKGILEYLSEWPTFNTLSAMNFAVDPSGRYIYSVTQTDDKAVQLQAYKVLTDGQLQPTQNVVDIDHRDSPRAYSIQIDPAGRFLYLILDDRILGFSISANGSLTSIGTVTGSDMNFAQMTFDTFSHYAYILRATNPTLSTYKIQPALNAQFN